MSKEFSEQQMNSLCKVCGNHLSLTSARQTSKHNIFKTTKCCNDSSPLHIKCVIFLFVIDRSYNFHADTYSDDDTGFFIVFSAIKTCFSCEKT